MRLDGEIVRGDGAGVHWRGTALGAREVLAKTVGRPTLLNSAEFIGGVFNRDHALVRARIDRPLLPPKSLASVKPYARESLLTPSIVCCWSWKTYQNQGWSATSMLGVTRIWMPAHCAAANGARTPSVSLTEAALRTAAWAAASDRQSKPKRRCWRLRRVNTHRGAIFGWVCSVPSRRAMERAVETLHCSGRRGATVGKGNLERAGHACEVMVSRHAAAMAPPVRERGSGSFRVSQHWVYLALKNGGPHGPTERRGSSSPGLLFLDRRH